MVIRPRSPFPILLAVAALSLLAQAVQAGPLPRLSVSLPPGLSAAEAIKIVQASGIRDVMVVLPTVSASVGGQAAGEVPRPAADLPASLPTGMRLALRLTLQIGPVSGQGRERETAIESRVSGILAGLALGQGGISDLVVDPVVDGAPPEVVQFALATLFVRARGVRPALRIALGLPPSLLSGSPDATTRVLAYIDAVVPDPSAPAPRGETGGPMAGKPVIRRLATGGAAEARAAAAAWLDFLMTPGAASADTVWLEPGSVEALRSLCASVQFMDRSIGAGFEMTAADRASTAVLVDAQAASPAVAFVGSRTADVAVLVKAGGSRDVARRLSVVSGGKPPTVTCHDPIGGRALDTRVPAGQPPGCRADSEYALVRASLGTADGRVFDTVDVRGQAGIRVEEIIARWQAAREAERLALDNYSVGCFLTLHFEATNLAASFDFAMELQQFADRSGVQDWVQTGFFVNGVRLGRGREFPLPQLEPEKVVTKPLDLRLDEKYVYELLGTETIDGRPTFVVGIRPTVATERLYSGRVWIDGLDFRQARLRLEQRDGLNNVASHVETQEFQRVQDPQGRSFTLLASIDAQEALNLGGRTIHLEKRYRFGTYTINSADYTSRLAAARASDDPMFRDTDEGLRALRKHGTERTVEPTSGKRIWALLGGVLFDGAYSFPVPLAGVSWVDFDFRKSGKQLSAFFAGPIFVANLSRQHSKDLRWGLDLSLNALPTVFRDYEDNREVKGRQIIGFEQAVGGLVAWQTTSTLALSVQGHLKHNLYRATSDTDPTYAEPASGLSGVVYGEAKYARRSFNVIASVEHGRRLGWRRFGFPTEATEAPRSDWTRYSVEASQHVFVGKLTRGGVSAGYFGGANLDRFSRYTPSFLARPKMHGIPSGVDLFDEVGMVGGYYGFNVLELAKLEGAYTHAWTRNADEGTSWRQFDGLDFTIGTAGPFGTFVQGSVSLALKGNLERYNTRWGTYLLFIKPLKR